MVNQSTTTPGIILKRRNVGESDRLVTIFTKHLGKITARAKGIRHPTAKRAGHLELFNTVRLQLIEGKRSFILAQTELLRDRASLKRELKLLRIAYHLVEVAERLTPEHQPQPEVFELLDRALSSVQLEKWKDEPKLFQAYGEKLLTLLGYGVPRDAHNRDLDAYIEEIIDQRLYSRRILS